MGWNRKVKAVRRLCKRLSPAIIKTLKRMNAERYPPLMHVLGRR